MARSDRILERLLLLHPKIIDLSLERMQRLLQRLGHPERKCPPVIHVAGTNGKGSTVAYLRFIIEAAGLKAHCYTSPHLVRFHERIRLAGDLIAEAELTVLLEECEVANGTEPITFFEITTAAALLAFSRTPADYVLLEVGLGGRLDATNVIDKPVATCITSIGIDHQQYLGETIELISAEKAGIIKSRVPTIIGPMPPEARAVVENTAERVGASTIISGQEWQSYEQHGRLVFQDDDGLLDLPMPALHGAHQIDNAGNAIAVIRQLRDRRITEDAIATGLKTVIWPARMQRLSKGKLHELAGAEAEIWLDGGHNADAGVIIARAFKAMAKTSPRPLIVIWGMLNTKDASRFMAPLVPLAAQVVTLTIPGEANAVPAAELARIAEGAGVTAVAAASLEEAVMLAGKLSPHTRVLICGSLYLAGHVLALHQNEVMTSISGAARR